MVRHKWWVGLFWIYQGSPHEKFKTEQVHVAWAGCLITSMLLATTSKNYDS